MSRIVVLAMLMLVSVVVRAAQPEADAYPLDKARAAIDRAVALGTLFLKGNKDVFLAKAKRYQGYS